MPATAVRDTAEFLDIDMDQITRVLVLIPDRLRFTDPRPGIQIEVSQQGHPEPCQDLPDRRGWQAQVIRDPVRTPPSGDPQADDPPFRAPWRPGWGP